LSQADLNGSAASAAMPLTPPAGSAGVRGAIARAAQATGVDFAYLLAQARLESSLNPKARATASSAAGLFQFTKGTWSTMLARHGAALGPGDAGKAGAAAATGAASALPASRAQLMALRYDPDAAAMMAAELAGDNSTELTVVLGRAPSSSELYLAHFLGAAGATRFLGALATEPGQSAAALLPKAAGANSGVFFDARGAPRSVGAVMAMIQTRMDSAMQDSAMQDAGNPDPGSFATTGDLGGLGSPAVMPPDPGPIVQQFTEAQTPDPALTGAGAGTAMSDTLRDTFGLAGANASPTAPAFVRSAYGQMQAFGL
jgi:hypothetical protein